MCTDHCKCYTSEEIKLDSSRNITEPIDGYSRYQNLHEDYYNKFGRSWVTNANSMKPLVWSTNRSDSFTNFEECLESWMQKKKGDNSIDLGELFGLTNAQLKGIN